MLFATRLKPQYATKITHLGVAFLARACYRFYTNAQLRSAWERLGKGGWAYEAHLEVGSGGFGYGGDDGGRSTGLRFTRHATL
jgi:hypothetical protein